MHLNKIKKKFGGFFSVLDLMGVKLNVDSLLIKNGEA
jgi:hypothetical protein